MKVGVLGAPAIVNHRAEQRRAITTTGAAVAGCAASRLRGCGGQRRRRARMTAGQVLRFRLRDQDDGGLRIGVAYTAYRLGKRTREQNYWQDKPRDPLCR